MRKKKKLMLTRREALATGLASIGALILPGCSTPLPPTYGHILRMGDNFTYIAQRTLLPGQSMAKEYDYRDITSMPAIGTTVPQDETYLRLQKNNFHEWRITIEGRVARPGSFSLDDLKRFPSRTQITKHSCEEGWSAIAEWTGVPLASILQSAGILPSARFVNFYSYDDWADGIDLFDALHPQTILTYGMNGKELSVPHGGPVRLRVEKQLGYKSMKFLKRIVVTDEFDDGGESGSIQNGWSWFAGI